LSFFASSLSGRAAIITFHETEQKIAGQLFSSGSSTEHTLSKLRRHPVMEWNATITDMKFHFKNNAFGSNNNEALNSSSLLFALALLLGIFEAKPKSEREKNVFKVFFFFLFLFSGEGME
jgi:hypothetical protein